MVRIHSHRSTRARLGAGSPRGVRIAALAASAAAVLAVTSCAAAGLGAGGGTSTPPPSEAPGSAPQSSLGAVPAAIPSGEVIGQGTVLDDGDGPRLCLGAVQESYPPQCDGVPLDGWDWAATEGWEEASGVRWGAFAVQGAYDGERLAVASPPIMLALYDPAPIAQEPLEPGTASAEQLLEIQEALSDALGGRALGSWTGEGRLEQQVVYDDGTLQAHLDAAYGANVVRVTSALRDVAE
ncbi:MULTISPECIES: hypothetical protein [unclassified Agrococcus]|uniref:hypothetical protein n=1 Tax=unclassified Agrococcus TaxID=2615065 RepID=UPI003615B756